jgi:putative lipoic acid-binding regulatory protein
MGSPTDDKEGLLEFPCRFPIKVMGRDDAEFQAHVLQIISAHVEDITADDITSRSSSKGKFLAVTVTIDAQNQEHLDRIYRTLTASDRVLYVL